MQVQKSVENHDVIKFRRHVDLPNILESLVEQVMLVSVSDAVDTEDTMEALGAAFGMGLMEMMKPKIIMQKKQL